MRKQYLLSVLTAISTQLTMAQDPTLEAFMPFNGSAIYTAGNAAQSPDASAANFGATYTTDRNGNPNSALLLNGSTYVDYGDLSYWQFGMDDFTVMLWMKGDPTQVGQGIPVGKRGFVGGSDRAYMFGWTAATSELLTYYRDDQGYAVVNNEGIYQWSVTTVPADEWHHIAMVFDRASNEVRTYIDGILGGAELLDNVTSINATGNTAGQLMVGRSSNGGQFFKGSVDDLYIFRKALSASEIAAYSGNCSQVPAPTATSQAFCSLENPTIGDLVATADGTLNWYTVPSGGAPWPLSTPIPSGGGNYYVSQTIGACESTRTGVVVEILTSPGLPTAQDQAFCALLNPTVNDLVATASGPVLWYDTQESTTELSNSTNLVTGNYYARQLNVNNGCLSNPRTVQVSLNTTPAPTAGNQTFCFNSNPTVEDLVATGSGQIAWFNLSQGSEPLALSTPLVAGTYSVAQAIDGCPSVFTDIQVSFSPEVPNPTSYPQVFCGSATVAELDITATGVVSWFSVPSGGNALSESTVIDAGIYYASQTINGCQSNRVSVTVEMLTVPDAPVVFDQAFCATDNPTVADLNTNSQGNPGVTVVWYADATGGSLLSGNTPVLAGSTYYAEAQITCASATRTPVQILPAIVVDNTLSIGGGAITSNQENASYQWYFCIDGFTPVNGATEQSFIPASGNGAYAVVVTTSEGCTATSTCQSAFFVVGIDENEKYALTAYPNPTSGILFLSQPSSGQVLDISGRSLMTFGNARSLDLSNLASGSYVVRTADGGVMRVVRE
jgi:hypothetical protein